jgi:TonB family protein
MIKNGNRILGCALVLSLIVHAIFAHFVHPMPSVNAAEHVPPYIRIVHMFTPPPPTPTPPPPKVVALKRPSAKLPSRITPPKTISNNHTGPISPPATPGVAPTGDLGTAGPSAPPGTPEPTPTPKPACSVPNAPAATVNVMPPSVPEDVEVSGTIHAAVEVTLSPDGGVKDAQIYRSAGNPQLDREALRAARLSTYRAEVRDCVSIGGRYLFNVDFTE